MSRNIYVTYGGRAYDATLGMISNHARQYGADDVWIYDDRWLMHQPFRKENAWAWDHPGHNGVKYGGGWYCWKAFIILHAMRFLKPGDCVLYTDGDTFPVADFRMLFDACRREGGIFAFEATGCINGQWCKRDVWEAVFPTFRDCIPELIEPGCRFTSQHATARFMVFAKSSQMAQDFLADWNRLCTTPGLTTRDPSKRPEFPGFEENRGDQSIFSLLCLKYGLPLHREADEFGNGSNKDRELYGQLFVQKYCAGDRNDLSGSKYRSGPE